MEAGAASGDGCLLNETIFGLKRPELCGSRTAYKKVQSDICMTLVFVCVVTENRKTAQNCNKRFVQNSEIIKRNI